MADGGKEYHPTHFRPGTGLNELGIKAGRTKGKKNKATRRKEKLISAQGLTPLDYLLSVLRNPNMPTVRRMEAARTAAPYVHPKMPRKLVLATDENLPELRVIIEDHTA